MNLFQIKSEYIQLAEMLIEAGGEITPFTEELLIINQTNLEEKGRSYGYVIRTMESDVDIIDKEIKRLNGLKKARVNSVERLKTVLSDAMQLFQIQKIETPTLKISFRKSESIFIENESLLDAKFLTVKTTSTPNKVLIKECIKSGEAVTGAVLIENSNIQIR